MKDIFCKQTIELENISCPACRSGASSMLTRTMDYDYFTTDLSFAIVRCSDCGLVYTNPRPKLSQAGKIYPPEYSAYHFDKMPNSIIKKARNFMQQGKAKRILKCIQGGSGPARIMDVGCGGPTLLNLLKDVAKTDLDLYGNDFSEKALEAVKGAGFNPVCGPFEDIQWQDDFFDVIVMNQVIEHLFDLSGNLDKASRLLKDGGTLFIETPSVDGIDAKLFRFNHWGGYHSPRHLQLFNAKTIRKTLEHHGFVIEAIEYLPSPNFWTSSVRNFLFRKGVPYALTKRMNYKNVVFMAVFSIIDTVTKQFHPTSNMRVIARRSPRKSSVLGLQKKKE